MEEYEPEEALLSEMGIGGAEAKKLARGGGCEKCMGTGYRGRTGIYEVLVMDDCIRGLVLGRTDTSSIRKKALEKGMETLARDGALKALKGMTTVEEVIRITQEN